MLRGGIGGPCVHRFGEDGSRVVSRRLRLWVFGGWAIDRLCIVSVGAEALQSGGSGSVRTRLKAGAEAHGLAKRVIPGQTVVHVLPGWFLVWFGVSFCGH